MRRLWDVLLAAGIDPAAEGWMSLDTAEAISADGTTVVGSGWRADFTPASYVAIIPEPTAGAVFGVVAITMASARRRRRRQRRR